MRVYDSTCTSCYPLKVFLIAVKFEILYLFSCVKNELLLGETKKDQSLHPEVIHDAETPVTPHDDETPVTPHDDENTDVNYYHMTFGAGLDDNIPNARQNYETPNVSEHHVTAAVRQDPDTSVENGIMKEYVRVHYVSL